MAARLLRSVAALSVVVAVLLGVVFMLARTSPEMSGAYAGRPSSPSVASSSPTRPPSATASSQLCGGRTGIVDAPEPTIQNRSTTSHAVLVGTVIAIGEPRWNTATGEAPDLADGWPTYALIYRPVTVAVETVVRGIDVGRTVTIRWLGGTVGCNTFSFSYDGFEAVSPGGRYVFFLWRGNDASGQPSDENLTDGGAWPIGSDGKVRTPLEGSVQLAALAELARSAPSPPPAP